jgi:integrase
MGVTIRQKTPGGDWWVFISHQGDRKSKKIGNKTTANKVAKELRRKIALGEYSIAKPEKKAPLFKDYAPTWLNYIEAERKASTHDEYSQILKDHVMPAFKNRRLDEITRGDIRNFLIEKGKDYSRSRVCLCRDVLSGVMGFAVDDELIASNPVTGITKKLKLQRIKDEIDPLDKPEAALLVKTAKGFGLEHYAFVTVALHTGLRYGEMLALQWGDIDYNSKFICMERSCRRGRITRPKNGKTRRVDLNETAFKALKQLEAARRKKSLKTGAEMPKLIFHQNGEPYPQNTMRRVFKKILKKAGIREIRFHDLRHSYAAILLSEGVSPYYVSQQLGHSSISITCDIYGKWITNNENRHADLLDSIFSPAPYLHPEKTKAVTV